MPPNLDLEDSTEYFQPDFNLSTLKVPRLGNLLVQYNIPYPSSARKGKLIEIFTQKVLPQSQIWLAALSRVENPSEGEGG